MVYHAHIILNALLECFTCIYTLYFKLPKMVYLSQLFINCMFAFFATGTAAYIFYNFTCSFNTKKQLLINARIK